MLSEAELGFILAQEMVEVNLLSSSLTQTQMHLLIVNIIWCWIDHILK